jgi:RNA polymerase sigma-70 factor (ECF subfamily)
VSEFVEQVVALRPMLVRVARQRLHNETWAEDAVSETLVAALEKPAAFAGGAMLRTWLVGILKHKVVDQIRRHTRECQVDAFDDDADFDGLPDTATGGATEVQAKWGDPQESLSRRQFMEHLGKCLQELPPQQRRAFMLRNWMEAETQDICSQLGVTSNNLGVILHRARNRLRASMQTQWFPVPAGTAFQPQYQA